MSAPRRLSRAARKRRASDVDTQRDHSLAFGDNGFFTLHRAIGCNAVIQCVWVYDTDIDLDGLKQFHHNLGLGLLRRRIERSPLKFARNRWVLGEKPVDIDIAECARPRAELSDWADERSLVPVDPERGPGWHLGVLPLTDGSTAVTLVCSHYLIDGFGLIAEVTDAVLGNTRDLGLPPPDSRTRRRALAQDARRTIRDVPEVARAAAAVTKRARRLRGAGQPSVSPPTNVNVNVNVNEGDDDDTVVAPTVTIQVSLDDWQACADALGGTTQTLVAGWTAKFAERMGRQRPGDGAVTLSLPISGRPAGETHANATSFVTTSVTTSLDPTLVTIDLREVRAGIRQGLRTLREAGDDSSQYLRLVGFRRKRVWKRMFDAMFADPNSTVICSYLGEVDPVFCRLDGTDSEWIMARVVNQHESRQCLERAGGQMVVQSWLLQDSIRLSIYAYQPGAQNTRRALYELAEKTLADFGLAGTVD
ncbi:wax ester/triacylglycerol synthase family O-acyltransferase [Mycobacterium stomatepiae]|uniref:Diacylglycerol O-acyltransferase n=1 Tax=Mycobacterium stomatepiae TaxID=470076 RepID=A0A7I7Q9J1_9MYCO|nr:wax ester/triacylglycerol synthase family O-acyltransferase [Mycobacterium stomatepiae]BBY22696.1 hypothetical protein MSTO_29010 [Mycobacterium stomatepiae]